MCRFRIFECSLWSRRLTDTFSFLPYIPRDAKQRSRWCNRIKGQHGKEGFFVTNSTVVCSKHFRKEDVCNSLTGRRFLVPGFLFCICLCLTPVCFIWLLFHKDKFNWTPQWIHRDTNKKEAFFSMKNSCYFGCRCWTLHNIRWQRKLLNERLPQY